MAADKAFTVSVALIVEYERDGAVAVRQVVSPQWLARLEASIERDIESPGRFYHDYVPDDGLGTFMTISGYGSTVQIFVISGWHRNSCPWPASFCGRARSTCSMINFA